MPIGSLTWVLYCLAISAANMPTALHNLLVYCYSATCYCIAVYCCSAIHCIGKTHTT
ncbi:hypothetical protein PF005_g10703 [Phytophthora fragariae]|uniref:Uncharacterized protein n=1 Tax=Phytophthora fragariae TaxID=53985 RepID=A0A6A3EX85_9STRA|nr:hypothetical protein PF003_g36370 [Phytophthora fragariae]KAE8938144.1 hypothetical protein PF009_g11968 [Phytophthora fragariae]KAE9011107.1 hypothetical protein PF011_g9507 [Phytophthora fragariae]KAE9113758.1 hypothetical protein PF007_g10625 [Phytophthora fragariae]KAE9115063.1 hypothetical protein PF010_g9482 [Phytophthora fragariae]